ncbi:transposase [Xaviernesmea oryzae]|uniref:Transposase n=1 Tax=Xaviernesmea oryzae TaxID=464029 RepID=A0A1Q9B270_9HYPH|nr:polysaccharide pyruvyl transferase family protein [Xaviernesmea oryzae]OLP62117.1 transposase [Xaviernesmea oryzae]SEL87992.1 Polysaccharide pyruvyl transferase [Xaviernesmea oryzae]
MKTNSLAEHVRAHGTVPLAWAGSTLAMNYLNLGDALSPVMVALMSGRDIVRVPSRSEALRMACVGTIGHGFSGGEVWFWGTGCSDRLDPKKHATDAPFQVAPDAKFRVMATRGPVSEALLTGKPAGTVGVYGDPVWLLPHFYRPKVEKRWKLGVIVHLSELADREVEAHLREGHDRYDIPAELSDDIHIINTVTSIGLDGMKAKMEEILSCERIVSTSLHGLVFAESYGIPCLPFPSHLDGGLQSVDLHDFGGLNLRIVDLYRGLGQRHLDLYGQPLTEPTDWQALISAIDATWREKPFDADALVEAFPLDLNMIEARPGETIWEHPLLQSLILQHDVSALNRQAAVPRPAAAKKRFGWLPWRR